MALGKFCSWWGKRYPKAVKCLVTDEEQLLNFFQIKDPSLWPQIRTTNAIERRFREVKEELDPWEYSQTEPAWNESCLLYYL